MHTYFMNIFVVTVHTTTSSISFIKNANLPLHSQLRVL